MTDDTDLDFAGFHDAAVDATGETLPGGEVFPTLVGRYQLLERVGSGGMGEVFRVYDQVLEEQIALKTLRPEVMSDPRARLFFKREVKLARRVWTGTEDAPSIFATNVGIAAIRPRRNPLAAQKSRQIAGFRLKKERLIRRDL